METHRKLRTGGNVSTITKERTKETVIGSRTSNRNGNGTLKLNSTAAKTDGMVKSSSHARACRIRAKKAIAIIKPIICKIEIILDQQLHRVKTVESIIIV